MAQCKQTAPDFIQDAFSPQVAVLCSHDAELVCQKNNLSFVELIQPFCRLNAEASLRDPGNISHTVRGVRVTVSEMMASPPLPAVARKMLSDAVSNALPVMSDSTRNNVISVGDYDLQLSASTPWFEAFRECFLRVSEPSDHEFTRHYLACIFVVSSSHADPMEQFSKLTQQQHHQQHNQPNKVPRWFCPNVLRYYVLIHDTMVEQEAKAESMYQNMKTAYGINSCHLLHINSHNPSAPATDSAGENTNLPNPWGQFMPRKRENDPDIFDLERSPEETTSSTTPSQLDTQTLIDTALEVTEESEVQPQSSIVIDHPLAPDSTNQMTADSDSNMSSLDNLVPRDMQNNTLVLGDKTKSTQYGCCLTLSDHDRLRIFIHEFIVRGLLPWAERMLRTLNEQVTTRKGLHRSFVSATKKWFGGGNSKSVSHTVLQEKANVVYTPEAPEMQLRRLGDLAFMFHLYDLAYSTYSMAKRDFNNDHAWFQYAGALEMACMSVLMQGTSSQRAYPPHYMESAVTTYLKTCKSPQFATRATLLSTEALKSKNMFAEAATQFINMTSEDSDLRSGLLLEQAAHCFINLQQPMVRKYSFHLILAGHRFSKAGQRRHAQRCYSQALQVYKGKIWSLAEDHINFTLGRHAFSLKQLDNATSAFKHLLTIDSKQSAPQQSAFLREYLFVYKQVLSTGPPDSPTCAAGELPQLPLPVVEGNYTKVLCCSLQSSKPDEPAVSQTQASSVGFDDDEHQNPMWQKLEELCVVSAEGSLPSGFRPSLQCYTKLTNNLHNPFVVVAEPITVQVSLHNPLKIPLVLSHLFLLWKFMRASDNSNHTPTVLTNEQNMSGEDEKVLYTEVLPELTLDATQKKLLNLKLRAKSCGELHITGLAYNLGTNHTSTTAVVSMTTQPQTSNNVSLMTVPEAADSNTLLSQTIDNPANKPSFLSSITVRGKQNVEVQGQRLNSTKEERITRMYGPDRRLDLIVLPEQARLQVSFCDVPESLLSGEVRQVSVVFTNSGSCCLHQLKVSCSNPDFFSFCESGVARDAVYQTVSGCSETSDQEYIARKTTPLFVADIKLPDGRLEPGETTTLPMFIRGPDTHGVHFINFLFYYQSSDFHSKMRHRVLRHTTVLTVQPSLILRASAMRAHAKQYKANEARQLNDIIVSVEVENINQAVDNPAYEFSLLQVSGASSCWHLHHLSTQRYSDIKILSQETTLMSFRAQRCQNKTDHEDTVFTNVTFDQLQIDSSTSPCSDFFFRSRIHTTLEEAEVEPLKASMIVEPPPADTDLHNLEAALSVDLTLVILWKASVITGLGDNPTIVGQHQVTVESLNKPYSTSEITKTVVEQQEVKLIKDPEESLKPAVSSDIVSQLLWYTLHYQRNVTHNFSSVSVCRLMVVVELHNPAGTELQVEIDTQPSPNDSGEEKQKSSQSASHAFQDRPSQTFRWIGHNQLAASIPPHSSHTMSLNACFWRSGLYNLASLKVYASGVSGKEVVTRVLQRPPSPCLLTVTDTEATSGS